MVNLNDNELEIAKVLYDNTYENYLNSADAVDKTNLSVCLDDLKVLLELTPRVVNDHNMIVCIKFLGRLYNKNDMMNFIFTKKVINSTDITYTVQELPNRYSQNLRNFDIIIETSEGDCTAGIIMPLHLD
jgi:hypothetical protein